MFITAGNMAGFVLALQIIVNFFPEAPGAPWAILAMFLVGWLIFRAPLAAWTTGKNYWRSLPRTFLVALGSSLFIFIGAVPVAAYLTNAVLLQVETSPLFIVVVVAAAIAGAILVYPFTYWLFRRGSYTWDPYDKVVIEPAFRPRAKMA